MASAWSSPSADTFPTTPVDEQGDVPRDTDMREDGATSMAALLIWERRELHDPQEPCSSHVRASMINRSKPGATGFSPGPCFKRNVLS